MRTIYLPVHCCCHPETRLGWVPVPAAVMKRYQPVQFRLPPVWSGGLQGQELEAAQTIIAEVGELIDGETRWLAVKSGHLPIDTWRRVPGFCEFDPAQNDTQSTSDR